MAEGDPQPDRQMRADRSDIAKFAPDHLARYRWAARLAKGPVLDAGCGTGYGTSILHALHDVVIGLDISEEALLFANENFPGPKYGLADIQRSEVFKGVTEKFGSITCFEVIEHLERPHEALRALYGVLDGAGALYCSVPNENDYPFVAKTYEGEEYPHLRHYTPGQFLDLLSECGFSRIGINCQKTKVDPEIVPGDAGRTIVCVAYK